MPEIPDFVNDYTPHVGSAPQVSPAALAQPAAALEHLGETLSGPAQEFNARYQQARRSADASNILAGVSTKLNDAAFRWSRTPDRQKAIAGFQAEAATLRAQTVDGLNDELLKTYVDDRFTAEAGARELETGQQAFRLESSKRVGELDANLAAFAQSAAGAKSEMLRAKIMDDGTSAIEGAVAGTWITPEEGATRKLGWASQVQEVRARQMIDAALRTQSPKDAQAASAALGDPAQFPGLNPEARERLAYRVDALNDRLESRAIARQAHADAVAERNLHAAQSRNETLLLAGIYNGKTVDSATLEKLAFGQQISPAGLEAVHSALTHQAEGQDDARTVVGLWHAIDTRSARPADILDAINANHVKGTTGAEMMRALDKGDESTSSRNAFSVLKTAMQGQAIEAGKFDAPEMTARYAEAQSEWHRRVAGGENPQAVLTDMVPRYVETRLAPTWLPPTKYGTPRSGKDVASLKVQLRQAFKAKQISQADAERQGMLVEAYGQFFDREDLAARARAAAGAKSKGAAPASGEATP